MKKVLTLLLVSILAGGVTFADDSSKKENFYLGLGFVADGTLKVSDKPTVNLFLGYGFRVVDGLPLFIGIEGLIGIQKIGEGTSTSDEYNTIVIDNGDYTFIGVAATYWQHKANFWSLDFSPRVYASIDLGDMIQGLVYMGLNVNRITYDTKSTPYGDANYQTAPPPDPKNVVKETSGTLFEGDPMFTTGFRVSVSYFYFEYQRLFYIKGDSKVDWNALGNKISLGFILRG